MTTVMKMHMPESSASQAPTCLGYEASFKRYNMLKFTSQAQHIENLGEIHSSNPAATIFFFLFLGLGYDDDL